jgi:TRAP-type C4-dicarboxylate transport system permease small subunit
MPNILRRTLDGIYLAGGIASAFCLIAIVCLIILQIASRNFGFAFRGGADYAGYAMAAASFLGFAYALNHGAHIRVSLLVNSLGKYRFWGELWCFGIATVVSTLFAWFACKFTYNTYRFNDVSSGLDATPLWIPQVTMAVGSVILALSFWDNLVTLIVEKRTNVRESGLASSATDVSEKDTI